MANLNSTATLLGNMAISFYGILAIAALFIG